MDFNRCVPINFTPIKKKGRQYSKAVFDDIEIGQVIMKKYTAEKKLSTKENINLRKRFKEYLLDVCKVIFSNTSGFEIPSKLGYILVGEFESCRTKCVDFVKTKELKKQGIDKVIFHSNQHTDGKAFMFIYKKINRNNYIKNKEFKKTIYKNSKYWTFKKCRTLSMMFYEYLKNNNFHTKYMKTYDIKNQQL